jgi:two-component system, response regulator PdtaR
MQHSEHRIPQRGAMMLPDQPGGSRPAVSRREGGGPGRGSVGVLIVEDDFLIGMQTEIALAEAGFDVVGVATTAEEAVALARQHRPSLAVMDIRLAGRRDGIDAAGELFRELGIRCVFATAHDDQRTRALAKPFAPLGWLAKPYTMASLVAAVQKAISATD